MNNFGRKHRKSRKVSRRKVSRRSKVSKGKRGNASKAMKRIRREKGVSVKQAWVIYRKNNGTTKVRKSKGRRRGFGYDPNMPSTLYFQGPYGQSYGGWGATAPGISAFRRRR